MLSQDCNSLSGIPGGLEGNGDEPVDRHAVTAARRRSAAVWRGRRAHAIIPFTQEGTDMADRIRVGIVGATVTPGGSGWGAGAHVPALHALPEYELKAVCTAHEATARASAEKFGAALAFHSMDDMVASPEVDLVIVCVRVPGHYDLVMKSLRAGKATFCEWPLGATVKEAEEMAGLARAKSLRTIVGLQAHNDPAIMYARELIDEGAIGEVLAAHLTVLAGAQLERGAGRIWQGQRKAGANTLTIAGGHALEAMCAVLGEFAEVSARVATRIKEWRSTETGQNVAVDSPDVINVAGRLQSGAEASVQVASVPFGGGHSRLDIYGRSGAMSLSANGALSIGPNRLVVTKGKEAAKEVEVPGRFTFVPADTPGGSPRNVAQAFKRYADTTSAPDRFDPGFDRAVTRHRLIEAIERASAEGKAVAL
jgi:predicted dehydrogenase